MKLIDLTTKLISIPSYLNEGVNESEVGQFVVNYLNRFPYLRLDVEMINQNRFNILATDGYPTKILLTGHLDTVNPGKGWQTNPTAPLISEGKITGLGASDMKGGLACILNALPTKPTKGLGLLFYIDEEYDFLGMKSFVKKYKDQLKPEFVISPDFKPSFCLGCRGLIEIKIEIEGKAAHAARPQKGINAIDGLAKLTNQLKSWLKTYQTPELGPTTLNLAYLSGGQNQGLTQTGEIKLGKAGNVVPDYAEAIIDIRPASPELNADKVDNQIKILANKLNLKIIKLTTKHDLGAMLTTKEKAQPITSLIRKPSFSSPKEFGYLDTQMIWENFDQPACLLYGPAGKNQAHTANESVSIKDLYKAQSFYQKVINLTC